MIGKKLFFLKKFIRLERLKNQISFEKFLDTYTKVKLNQFINSQVHNDRYNEKEISLLLFKIDWQNGEPKFKKEALEKIFVTIRDEIREQDVLAHWDKDEFIILLTECNNESAGKIAELIKGIVEAKSFINTKVSLSYGMSLHDIDDSVESFIQKATDGLRKSEKV